MQSSSILWIISEYNNYMYAHVNASPRSKTTRVNRRVKRSCDITVDGMTVTITEIEALSTTSD